MPAWRRRRTELANHWRRHTGKLRNDEIVCYRYVLEGGVLEVTEEAPEEGQESQTFCFEDPSGRMLILRHWRRPGQGNLLQVSHEHGRLPPSR